MTELSIFHPRLSVKHSQQILRMYNNVVCKYIFIALTLQNNLRVGWLVSLSTTLCCFTCFLDAPLQMVANQSFLPFILEAEQKGSILRQDCLMYCVFFLL